MQRDIRHTGLYQEAEALFEMCGSPGTGRISDACEVSVSPDGRAAVFAGTLVDALGGLATLPHLLRGPCIGP